MHIIGLISDILLLTATLGMALWCRVLTRRLRAFDDHDTGLGGTIAALLAQVEALKASLEDVTKRTRERETGLETATAQADDRIGRMEMLLASLEDMEEEAAELVLQEPADSLPRFRASRPCNAATEGR